MKHILIGSILVLAGLSASCDQRATVEQARLIVPGQITLEFISGSNPELSFRLSNGTDRALYFRGDGTETGGINPWDAILKCKAFGTEVWIDGPYAIVDGKPARVKVPARGHVDLKLVFDHHRRFLDEFSGSPCILAIALEDGTSVESSAFQN